MSNVLNNLKEVWLQANLGHRVLLVTIIVGFLGVVGGLTYWASQPDLALLYGGLAPSDAAQIAEKLRDEDIPHRIKDGGTTILVPSDQVHELRATMVLQGLPAGGNAGYKILDESGLGNSPFKERVNYVRAIEGELARTIKLISGVETSRVHINSEERSIWRHQQREASATVAIRTTGNVPMSRANVMAITNLVAGAVKGVSANKVVVVVNGRLEAGEEKDEIGVMSGSLFEHRMRIEKYLATKAEEQLAMVLGPGRASVKVNVQLSTASIKRTAKTIDTKSRVEASIETVSKDVKPGTVASNRAGNSRPVATGSTKEKTEKTDYEIPYEMTQEVDGPGKIQDLSAAVFVDLSAPQAEGTDESGQGQPAPQGPKLTVQQIESVVQKALGLGANDTGKITVVDVPFQKVGMESQEPMQEAGMFSKDFLLEMAKRGSLAVVVVGMLLALKILSGKKAKGAIETATAEATEAGEGAPAAAAAPSKPKAPTARQMRGPDRALRTKIVNSLGSEPDKVKQLFLSWVESSSGD